MSKPVSAPCQQGPWAANHSEHRRASDIRYCVVHTAEASDDFGEDRTAEGVANFFANPATQASTQLTADSDSCVRMLSDLTIPWGATGGNTHGLHIEICGRAGWVTSEWMTTRHKQMLDRAAYKVAMWCYQYKLPLRWVGPTGLKLGRKGITTHKDINDAYKGGSHWDPGPGFPRDYFLTLVKGHHTKIKAARKK